MSGGRGGIRVEACYHFYCPEIQGQLPDEQADVEIDKLRDGVRWYSLERLSKTTTGRRSLLQQNGEIEATTDNPRSGEKRQGLNLKCIRPCSLDNAVAAWTSKYA